MGDSDSVEVGDFVIAVGNPFGLGQTVTSGLVGALGRTGVANQGYEEFIQTDAPINAGNSGGALVNMRESSLVSPPRYSRLEEAMSGSALPCRSTWPASS